MKALLSKLDPHTVTAIIGAVVGLAVANGLVTNDDGKIITGAVSALVALGVLVYGAVKHHSSSQVAVAKAYAAPPLQFTSGTATAGAGTTTVTLSPPPAPPAAPAA